MTELIGGQIPYDHQWKSGDVIVIKNANGTESRNMVMEYSAIMKPKPLAPPPPRKLNRHERRAQDAALRRVVKNLKRIQKRVEREKVKP